MQPSTPASKSHTLVARSSTPRSTTTELLAYRGSRGKGPFWSSYIAFPFRPIGKIAAGELFPTHYRLHGMAICAATGRIPTTLVQFAVVAILCRPACCSHRRRTAGLSSSASMPPLAACAAMLQILEKSDQLRTRIGVVHLPSLEYSADQDWIA